MSPNDTDISRTVEGALNTTFTWDFKAAIGGAHWEPAEPRDYVERVYAPTASA